MYLPSRVTNIFLLLLSTKYLQRVADAFQVDSNRYGTSWELTHARKRNFLNSLPELVLKALPCCWNVRI